MVCHRIVRNSMYRALMHYTAEIEEEDQEALRASFTALLDAATAVIAAWEDGNLAVAVRDLAQAVKQPPR
jgi:hypothetical protein